MVSISRLLLTAAAITAFFATPPAVADETECGTQRTIEIAMMKWSSAAVLAHIDAIILKKGFGCGIALIPGDTVPTLTTIVARGMPVLAPELWVGSNDTIWNDAVMTGRVASLGPTFSGDQVQGWYIPDYVAADNLELKSARDLKDYASLFADPLDPEKGRFVSCPFGWTCEVINANLLKAYGLDSRFNLFQPSSGEELDAVISDAFADKQPIVFYYWSPSAMMSRNNVVRLDMDPFDAEKFACIIRRDCTDPQPTDFVEPTSVKGVAGWLPRISPDVSAYLAKMTFDVRTIEDLVLWGEDNHAGPQTIARYFLRNEPDIWTKWVPEDVAERVLASL